MSPKPTYLQYDQSAVETALNDDRKATGRMWLSSSALTWVNASPVIINIQLAKPTITHSIRINIAGGGQAEVRFPQQILAYNSLDNKNFFFAAELSIEDVNIPQKYAAEEFELPINRSIKYIKLVIFPTGPYFSVDDIKIYSRRNEKEMLNDSPIPTIPIDSVLLDAKKRFSNYSTRQYYNNDQSLLDKHHMPPGGQILQRRAAFFLNKRLGKKIIVEAVSPWLEVDPVAYIPGEKHEPPERTWIVPVGTCKEQGFLLTNSTQRKLPVHLQLEQTAGLGKASIRESIPVRDRSGRSIFDPLVPSKDIVDVEGGETKFLFMKFCATTPGVEKIRVRLNGENEYHTEEFEVRVNNMRVKTNLESSTWGYLISPQWKAAHSSTAALLRKGETAVVVPTELIAGYPSVNKSSAEFYIQSLISKEDRAKKILLFIDMKQRGRTDREKADYILWYKGWLDVLRNDGIQETNVYVYPFDEPQQENIAHAAEFLKWHQNYLPKARVFLTINAVQAMSLQNYADIICFHSKIFFGNYQDSQKISSKNYWIYFTDGPSKDNDVYNYYKLAAWKAFLVGAKGVGFWSSTDNGGTESSWNDSLRSGKVNYSVLYTENGSAIPGRRWEAWVSGITDISIITGLDMGVVEKNALKDVVEDYSDSTKADKTISAILNKSVSK